MSQHGKTYREARSRVDREQAYSPLEAIRLLKDLPGPKFDETVEAHFRLGLNVRHADQQLRGTLMLPNGTGKEVRVAVFAEGEKAKEAADAGADIVGSADLATVVEEIVRAKPAAAKGRYIEQITITTTMGPGIHVNSTRTRGITEELEEATVSA